MSMIVYKYIYLKSPKYSKKNSDIPDLVENI